MMSRDWMEQGTCTQNPEANKLFMSRFLEPFDEEEFYADKLGTQKLTKKEEREMKQVLQPELESARTEHDLGHRIHTAIAKSTCASCPVREACEKYAIEQEADGSPMYGIVAGLTLDRKSVV